ncbi:MAG: hypothetical protein AB7I08_04415 [Thermoleophilia bacterium]
MIGCAATAALAPAAIGALASTAFAGNGPPGQVTICHATESATNPYVVIHPATPAVLLAHLKHHDGADIVPPFTYKGTSYPGQNWTAEGKAIADNGCLAVAPPPELSPPAEEPEPVEPPEPPAEEPPVEEPPAEEPPSVFGF